MIESTPFGVRLSGFESGSAIHLCNFGHVSFIGLALVFIILQWGRYSSPDRIISGWDEICKAQLVFGTEKWDLKKSKCSGNRDLKKKIQRDLYLSFSGE